MVLVSCFSFAVAFSDLQCYVFFFFFCQGVSLTDGILKSLVHFVVKLCQNSKGKTVQK